MTLRRWALALACVVVGWMETLMLVMVTTDAFLGAIALFINVNYVSDFSDGASVAGIGGAWVAVRSDLPGLGLALSRARGRVVLPDRLPGCLPLPDRVCKPIRIG